MPARCRVSDAAPADERQRQEAEPERRTRAPAPALRGSCRSRRRATLSSRVDRPGHREGVEQRAEREHHRQRGEVGALREAADRRAAAVVRQLVARHAEADGDVVVRARLHAVEAEGAIEVADLHRLEERKLAPALRDVRRRGFRAPVP